IGWLSNATVSARNPMVLRFAMLWLLTACACMICFAPVIATYIPLSMVLSSHGPLGSMRDIDDGLRQLIGGGDDLRIGLKCPLRRDHVHQLRRQVDIGAFQGARLNAAESGR